MDRHQCRRLVAGLLLVLVSSSVASVAGVRTLRITEHPTDMTVAKNDPVTLKCSVDGSPAPIIEWYRDGELIISSSSHKSSNSNHRVMLPGGDLFFFRVVHSRKESDAGVYWCVARNSHGSVRSRNATLTVAYLHPEFRTVPLATRGILGESATLECEAPRGHPEPQVRWKKNGQPLDLSGGGHLRDQTRVRMDDSGNLIFTKLTSSDEGRYQCLAQNVVATRETPAVLLSIHVRPIIIRPPQDTTALIGSEVVLECGVSGDPPPHVEWRRHDGVKIPANRIRVDHIKTNLRLERLVAADAGRYVCEAENSVGSSSASAHLTILVPPTWNTSAGITSGGHAFLPREIRSYLDQNVYLDCPVHGSPLPLVFWQRETQGRGTSLSHPELLTHDTNSSDNSRWKVFRNGTLAILSLRREDAGGLWCGAVSEAGGLVARTRLEVITVSSPSPPVIEVGPANQTLPLGSVASLVCSATEPSSHKLALRWWKDGTPLSFSDRMTQSGDTLRIQNLQPSDAGNYTCWIGAGEQVSAWTSSLSIANDQSNSDGINIHNPNDPMALPGSPSQPRLLHKSSTSLTVGWQSGPRMGASPLQGYVVEIFSSSDPSSSGNNNLNSWTWAGSSVPIKRYWRIVARGLKADQFTIKDLQPATSYSVLVRAENSHGLSLPSPTSPWFTTSLSGGPQQELEEGRQRLSSSLTWLRLDPVRPVNATTVRLNWRWLDGADGTEPAEATVEGLHLWYRPLHQNGVQSEETIEHQSFRSVKISHQTLTGSTYVLSDLIPSTRYLFFLVPFYRNVDGRPSNSQTLTTLEAAPEGPPRDLMIRQLNSSSCLVKWNEPLAEQRNGVITGYQIYVFMDDSNTLLANMTLPPTPTSVIIGNLVAGSSYAIRAAAWTLGGLGPASDESSFTMELLNFQQNPRPPLDDLDIDVDDEDNNINKRDRSTDRGEVGTRMIHETWFILAIGGVLLSTLVLLVAALVIRRRWIRNKAMSTMSSHVHKIELGSANGLGDETLSHNGHRGNNNTRDILWSRGWPLEQPSNSAHHQSRNGSVLTSKKEAELEAQTSLLAQQQYSNSGAPPEYAELLNHHIDAPASACSADQSQLSLSSFLPRRNNLMMQAQLQAPPSAYATTTLVNPLLRGQQPPYSGKSSSGDSSSGSYVVDHQHPNNGSRNNSYHSRKNSSAILPNGGHHQQQQQHRIPNLVDLLPPPPRHPPPPSPAPNTERSSHKDKSLPIAGKPQLKLGSGNSSPALSKRSAPGSTTSSFKPPSSFYQASLQSGSFAEQQMCVNTEQVARGQEEGSVQFVRSSLANSKSHSAIKSPVRRLGNSNGSQSSRPFPVSNYTAPMNYHCNPLDNITTQWDDDGDDDYSRSISGGADDSELSDGTEDMRSSVYDNNPVVYRPTQREVNASPKDRPNVTMK